jgi:hypothetical protein
MVEVTKYLENRYQCLKWMYQQGTNGFIQRDVISKFHVPTTFLAACAKKNIVKAVLMVLLILAQSLRLL